MPQPTVSFPILLPQVLRGEGGHSDDLKERHPVRAKKTFGGTQVYKGMVKRKPGLEHPDFGQKRREGGGGVYNFSLEFFPKPKAEPPEPFSRNRNRNRSFLSNCTETPKIPFKEEPPEPKTGAARTVPSPNRNRTEPNRGLPASGSTILHHQLK